MKKLLFLLLISCFIPIIVIADVDTMDGTAITTTSDIDGFTSNISKIDGQPVASGDACADSTCDGFIICENFEGTGTPSGWTISSTGTTVDFDNSTSPLRGSEDLELKSSSGTASTVYYAVDDGYQTGSWWGHFTFTYPSTPVADPYLIASIAFQRWMYINYSDQLVFSGTTGTTTLTPGTTYHLWFYYAIDGDENYDYDIYISTSRYRPGTPEITGSGSVGGLSIYRIEFTSTASVVAQYEYHFDQVLLSTSEIGTVCE